MQNKDILFIDTETYSDMPIKNGVYRYAEGVEIMLFQFALNNGRVVVVDLTKGKTVPNTIIDLILNPDVILCGHNTMFDRTVLVNSDIFKDNPKVKEAIADPNRWLDTMIMAYAHSLKGGLDDLCGIFKLGDFLAKDKDGKKLIQLFCKPQTSKHITRATYKTHPDEWAKFVEYARQDIVATRALLSKLPTWNLSAGSPEHKLWALDQTINDRGVYIDLDLANKCLEIIEKEKVKLSAQTAEQTNDQVQSATQRDAILRFIKETFGRDLKDLTASTVQRILDDEETPQALKDLLLTRVQASTSSTSKYLTLINRTNPDSRLRGSLQFMGAPRTGRWAGRGFQPQNLPRPSEKQETIDEYIDDIKTGSAELLYPNLMKVTSNVIRGCIAAPKGKKLVVSDYSNIEGRGLAWLANEEWKLKAFFDFDAGKGHDIYKRAYAETFGTDAESVDKGQRQVGKVLELSMGYEGGVGAFITFSKAYGIDLDEMADLALPNLPERIIAEAKSALTWATTQKRTYGLSDKAYIACDALKRSWREAHPNIARLWGQLDKAVRGVLSGQFQNKVVINGLLEIDKLKSWLRIKLPSGRYLCYPGAKISPGGKIEYLGQNTYTRKWGAVQTYGGKLSENITQAVARDIMAYRMPLVESKGFDIVLTVHDEIITEAPDTDEFNADYLGEILTTKIEWGEGFPLAAAGFETYRYKKD